MNLSHYIERQAARPPRHAALFYDGQDIGYPQLWRATEQATCALLEAGIRQGDRVAWLGFNDPAMLALLLALARIGAILLPLNYRLAPAEQAAILAHAGACLIVADAAHGAAAASLAGAGGLAQMAAHALRASSLDADAAELQGRLDGPVLLVYTSGTTGRPKGALHRQAALLANSQISRDAHGLTAGDHVLSTLPMFHVGGLCIQTLPALLSGASVTLHPRFDAGAWLLDVQSRRPSLSLMVPATLRAVLEHMQFAATDLSSLRLLMTGSSIVPTTLIEAFHARGVAVGQVYGATETGPVSIFLQHEHALGHVGSAGKPGRQVQVRRVDAQGQEVANGGVGEILIRAPNLMAGYWNDPDNPSFQDGWFHSGDLARVDDDGFYWIVGRSSDMIISGGENIHPAEIENILAGSSEIVEYAVVGQSDARWGEVVIAIVVKRPGSTLDEAAVLRLFEGKLARYKIPRRALFRDSLPRTALGKVQKAELRAALESR
jgi:fatty-acyl-CoA synthase